MNRSRFADTNLFFRIGSGYEAFEETKCIKMLFLPLSWDVNTVRRGIEREVVSYANITFPSDENTSYPPTTE